MAGNRVRALGAALGAGCLLLAAGGGPGVTQARLAGSTRSTRLPHDAPAAVRDAAAAFRGGDWEDPAPEAPPRAHPPAEALGSAPSPGGPAPWWLEPGPALEVRIGRHAVPATAARLDPGALEAVEAGDRIRLALPEVGALDVVVQRIASPAPGVRQLQGHLADPVEDYPATLTLGPVFAFANVATPTGAFVAEFENGAGWVLYDDLEDRLVDHGVSDERIPPRGEGAG